RNFGYLLAEGMIFFEKRRIHAASRKKSDSDSATPNFGRRNSAQMYLNQARLELIFGANIKFHIARLPRKIQR
ncbi:MAG: hypothetical protein AAFY26_19255, partial [Cyanobacteria bacterium J06638_22]